MSDQKLTIRKETFSCHDNLFVSNLFFSPQLNFRQDFFQICNRTPCPLFNYVALYEKFRGCVYFTCTRPHWVFQTTKSIMFTIES